MITVIDEMNQLKYGLLLKIKVSLIILHNLIWDYNLKVKKGFVSSEIELIGQKKLTWINVLLEKCSMFND